MQWIFWKRGVGGFVWLSLLPFCCGGSPCAGQEAAWLWPWLPRSLDLAGPFTLESTEYKKKKKKGGRETSWTSDTVFSPEGHIFGGQNGSGLP